MKIEDSVRATLVARADAVHAGATKTPLNRIHSHAPRAPDPAGGWTRRRAVTIGTAAAVFVAAGLFAWSAFNPTPDATSSQPVASLSPAVCHYSPWAELCPEAAWVRNVLRDAGITPTGNTGSAIVARSGGEFYVWTTYVDEEGQISKLVSEGGFESVQLVDGTAVYSDGTRFLWQVGNLYVWLQSGEKGFSITPGLVATLVLSSQGKPETATQIATLCARIGNAISTVQITEARVQRDLHRLQAAKLSGNMLRINEISAHLQLARAVLGESEATARNLMQRLNHLLAQTASS